MCRSQVSHHGLLYGAGSLGSPDAEASALDVLYAEVHAFKRDITGPNRRSTEGDDAHDVRVVDLREGTRFTNDLGLDARVVNRRVDLERDVAPELEVGDRADETSRAAPPERENLVAIGHTWGAQPAQRR